MSKDFINYDSSYQYFLMQHPFEEMLRLLPEDFSPPMYAVTLKLFTDVFGNTLFVMRVFNLIAIVSMLYIAAFPVRQLFGVKASVICTVLMTISSINIAQLPEIRPTYFSIFYFTAVGVCGYKALFSGKLTDLIALTVFSVIAMYTHNVAMLGTLGIYITMLVFALIMKERRRFVNILICGVICAVAYIPWLRVVFYQFGNVQDNFWSSGKLDFQQIFSWTISSPFEYEMSLPMHSILLIVAALLLVMIVLKNIPFDRLKEVKKLSDISLSEQAKHTTIRGAYMVCSFIMPVLLLLLFSELVYPLATSRYFHIFSGVLIIVISVGLANCRLRVMPWVFIGLCVYCFCAELCMIADRSSKDNVLYVTDLPEVIGSDAKFLHYHEWSLGPMCYYFPEGVHYVSDDTYTILRTYDVFTADLIEVGAATDIYEYTDEFYVCASGGMNLYMSEDIDEMMYATFPDAEIEQVGICYIPETFLSNFELYRVKQK
ncbi:MAG: glycosyltransferase family 39 protein [Ruminococcaceae bacterium]|nr:glycosyltransferase family 39 protein [Oscillospiraceae bacterium]